MAKEYNKMKNIHILPTDKLSRLFIAENDIEMFILSDKYELGNKLCKNQHIYITSDEEIKEGYYLDLTHNIVMKSVFYYSSDKNCKKIILTTDPDIIKDGVQAIDDEFLEWFVKNPSCEEIGLEREHDDSVPYPKMRFVKPFKIIIPQEKPKQ
jgi:hypothetical protein